MFFRGRKVIITESNAHKHTHPTKGDVGYLGNMFLFPIDNFILANIFICSHKKDTNARVERKNFILDLGMSATLKSQISRDGVNRVFFLQKTSLNLNPCFFMMRSKCILSFPQLVGTYGIWPGYTSKSKKQDRHSNSLFRIPCGQISVINRKEDRLLVDSNELQAWIRAISPNISSILMLINRHLSLDGHKLVNRDQIRNIVSSIWNNIAWAFYTESQFDQVTFLHLSKDALSKASNNDKALLIRELNKLNSLLYVSLSRLTASFVNSYNDDMVISMMRSLLKTGQISHIHDALTDAPMLQSAYSVTKATGKFILECLYRTLMVDPNTRLSLKLIQNYLPSEWDIEEIIEKAETVKEAADANSAALNRIQDVLFPKKESWAHKMINMDMKMINVDMKDIGRNIVALYSDPEEAPRLNSDEVNEVNSDIQRIITQVKKNKIYVPWNDCKHIRDNEVHEYVVEDNEIVEDEDDYEDCLVR
jgi:hypothetical protein